MKVLTCPADGVPGPIFPDRRGTIVTVGTCDGVHRGHREVLELTARRAAKSRRRSVLLTFEPHPLSVVSPEYAPELLTTGEEKREVLATTGVGNAVFMSFTRALSRYSPRRFVEEVLVGRLAAREIIVGHDHGFGRNRSGDAQTLRRVGAELGFEVRVVPPLSVGGSPVSSSRIRRAIARGELTEAAECLGRPYVLTGRVIRGEGRGARIGFPTANLDVPPDKLLPPAGIYAVQATLPDGRFAGALHTGPRPTFPGASASVEVHLMDYPGDPLLGERLRLDLMGFVRPIEAFPDAEHLAEAITRDVKAVSRLLAGRSHHPTVFREAALDSVAPRSGRAPLSPAPRSREIDS